MTKLGLALLGISVFINTTFAQEFKRFAHPTQLIVELNDSSYFQNSFLSDMEIRPLAKASDKSKALFLVSMNSFMESSSFIEKLDSSPDVSKVYPNYIYEGNFREFAPNDSLFDKQSHHKIIKSTKAWAHDLGREEVIVAVTDDGFLLDHEDLEGSWYINTKEVPGNNIDDDSNGYIDDVRGWDFNEGDNNPGSDYDNGNHGTHVAGTIAAGFDNGIGITGISPKIKVMPLKFYGVNRWTSAMIFETYRYAVDNGAKVVSTSYNIDFFIDDEVYKKALSYMYDNQVIFFNSAGNTKKKNPPRVSFEKILLVGSTTSGKSKLDKKSRFSNYGDGIDIMAPGDPIYSTVKSGRYGEMSGTSMATPVAASIAAYIWSVYPELNMEQVVSKMFSTAENINGLNSKYKNQLGSGRVLLSEAITTEEAKPLTVDKMWFDRSDQMIYVRFKGILKPDLNLTDTIKIFEGEDQFTVSFEEGKYFMGTNTLKAKFVRKGNFTVKLEAQDFLDPFDQELDGDNDSIAGGDFEFTFKNR